MSPFQRSRSVPKRKTAKASNAYEHFEIPGGKASKVLGEDRPLDRSWSITSTAYRRPSDDTASSSDRLPSVTLSQASTLSMPSLENDLHRKASSVLLRKDIKNSSYNSDSSRSRGLRECDSMSSLRSHYDAHSAPLSISQQTSASSARDLALRKGMTPIARLLHPRSGGKETSALKSTQSEASLRGRKPKPAPIDLSTLFPRPGSVKRSSVPGKGQNSNLNQSTNLSANPLNKNTSTVKLNSSTTSNPRTRNGKIISKSIIQMRTTQFDPIYPKVNVRKPKAGVTEWFDEIDILSEDERNQEPDFRPTFVEDMESAFRNGAIRPKTAPEMEVNGDFNAEVLLRPYTAKNTNQQFARANMAGDSRGKINSNLIVNIPKANLSEDTLRLENDDTPVARVHSNRLATANLNEESVLWLSSSDDEDDEVPLQSSARTRRTVIRDSVAIDAIEEAEIEIGTAKAVSKQEMTPSETPQIKRLKGVKRNSETTANERLVPTRRSSKMFSYLNDTPTESRAASTITSFPSDFSDVDSDDLASESIRSSFYVDPGNTRLMTVTRQEELLLAAMRAKRANMGGTVNHGSVRSLSAGSSRKSLKLYHPTPRNLQTGTPVAEQLDRGLRRISTTSGSIRFRDLQGIRDYYRRSGVYSRASGTTFQSGRVSTNTFHSISTHDSVDECTSSREESPQTPHARREPDAVSQRSESVISSNATASPEIHHQHSRHRTDSGNVIVLDDLNDRPKRETVSQEFIEWPYSGWDSRAGPAVAR